MCNAKGCTEALQADFESVLPANNIKILDTLTNEGNSLEKKVVQTALTIFSFRLSLDLPMF